MNTTTLKRNFFTRDNYNTKLLESDNFVVIPSLGSLVEGWVLIVPKAPHLNFSQIDSTQFDELESIIRKAELLISASFGESVMFEHGPNAEKSKVGCGVDYAHLHLVPVKFDLIHGLKSYYDIKYQWRQIDALPRITNFKNGANDYLYLRDQSGKHWVTTNESIPSQLFRKVIAQFLGTPNKFDWKEFPELHRVQKTISLLQPTELLK